MGVMLEQEFLDAVTPGFRDVYFASYVSRPTYYDKICTVDTSTSYSEKISSIAPTGVWTLKNQAASILFDDPKQLYDKTITHSSYASGFEIAKELWDDDLVGVMKKLPKEMGKGAYEVVEQLVANIYNNGFASGTSPDGQYLFDTDHPIEGSTQANRPTTAVDLSATSLEDAILNYEAMVNYKGLLMGQKVKKLIVPAELKYTAMKLLKSDLDPESAENAINPLKSEGIQLVVNPYLTDADSWFISGGDEPIRFYWREKPTFEGDVDKRKKTAYFTGFMRVSVVAEDYLGLYGVPGA